MHNKLGAFTCRSASTGRVEIAIAILALTGTTDLLLIVGHPFVCATHLHLSMLNSLMIVEYLSRVGHVDAALAFDDPRVVV